MSPTIRGARSPAEAAWAWRCAELFAAEYPERPAGPRHGVAYGSEGEPGWTCVAYWTQSRGLAVRCSWVRR